MSWELASFLILGALLLAGFAWYERSRPPAQVVAMVAALAALAIAGRVAFAAFPNVKPTTDIVIFAGYALGPAGGFAVGGLTALVSNIWFGQGPWTPWQMAGWGMCGLLGAALAIGGRNVGRFTLAAVCGLAGLLYGALLNFSLMATYGGDLSLEHFLVLESRAIPFDAAHAIGNIVFALVAGPAMIRMLVRFRERFEWRTPALTASLLLVLALATSLPATARADSGRAASWLVSVQNSDGGFGSSAGDNSSTTTTAWVMLGLAAADRNARDVSRSGKTPVDYLRSQVSTINSAGALARTILALDSAGADPRSFGGRDLISALLKHRRSDGSYGEGQGWPGTTAYAIVALRASGAGGGLSESTSWLAGAQNNDGGWGDLPAPPSNADVTGAAMQAIPNTKAAKQGASYLRKHQRADGGWPLAGSGPSNSQSTAWAAQGLIAAGQETGEAIDFLNTLQAPDGHYRYSTSSDQTPVFVTGQALVPAAGRALPVPVPARAPKPEPAPTTTPSSPGGTATPAPIPGVESIPSSPSGSGTELALPPGSAGSGGASSGSGPLVPEVSATGPETGLPPAETEGSGLTEASPASAVEAAEGSGTSPWVPIGIALGLTALAVAVPWALGRRFAW
jgi:energy-coupling factor transport system substrate-specific component